MLPISASFPAATDSGALGVSQVKRLWARALAARRGAQSFDPGDTQRDQFVIHALGLGLEQTMQYLMQGAPEFAEFEGWIVATAGEPDPAQVRRINAALAGEPVPGPTQDWLLAVESAEPVLSADDLAHWDAHGYVIVRNAVPEAARSAAEQAIWTHLGARVDDADSWYVPNDHGIMVQYFQHPAFTANRQSSRIHKAFAQLWRTADLWPSTDRVGFNVPERPGWMFRGPHLHWDVSLKQPIPFGTQGILYLTDTPGEQGAFTCVPGFQRRVGAWLAGLPPGADARQEDLHALGSKPIAGQAGDLVIWHHALPHGSRPNRGLRPRIVQYINLRPYQVEEHSEWI